LGSRDDSEVVVVDGAGGGVGDPAARGVGVGKHHRVGQIVRLTQELEFPLVLFERERARAGRRIPAPRRSIRDCLGKYYPIYSHDFFGAVRFDPATDYIVVGGEGGTLPESDWHTA